MSFFSEMVKSAAGAMLMASSIGAARVVAAGDRPLEHGEIDAALAVLCDGELVFEQAIYPVQEYAFKHALTLEVAYNTQLADRRRPLHAATARALVEAAGQKVDEQAALIGRQFEAAEEWLEAARWYAQAAEWMMRSDVVGAMPHFRKAHDLIGRVPASEEGQQIDLQTCLGILGLGVRLGLEQQEHERMFARGMSLAEQLGNHETAARMERLRTLAAWSSGQRVGNATPEVSGATDPESMLQISFTAAATAMYSGALGQAVAASDDAMELIERRPGLLTTAPFSLLVLCQRAIVLQYNGRLDEAEELSSRVLEAARLAGQVEIEGFANSSRAYAHLARGHSQEALRHVRRALEIAEQLGSPMSRANARLSCALVGSFLALWPETERWGQEGVAIIREHHVGMMFEPFLLTCWAEALAARGERERAQDIISEAIAKAQSFGRGVVEVRAHLGHARILLCAAASPNTNAIAAALQAAETLAREIDSATWLPWVYEERAALARLRGDESQRRAGLEEAWRLYDAIGASGHLQRLARELAPEGLKP